MFMFLCVSILGWLASDTAILFINNVNLNNYVWNLGLLFAAFTPPACLLVVYQFMSHSNVSKKIIRLLFILSSITALVALTSPLHSLMRNAESLIIWPRAVEYSLGAWFYVHTVYSFLMAITSIAVLIRGFSNKKSETDHVSGALFVIALVLLLSGNILYTMNVLPIDINPTSMGAAMSLLFMHLALTDRKFSITFRIFNTFKSRTTFPVLFVMYVMMMLVTVYVARTTRLNMEEIEDRNMIAATQSVSAYLASHERLLNISVSAIGDSAELVRLMQEGDREAIWQFTNERKQHYGIDEIIISSVDGVTISRSHMRDSFGDDISGAASIAAALNGQFLTLYTPTPTAYMVMSATAPIMDGNTLLGIVVANFVIGHNNFLDNLKDTFAVDITIFNRDGYSVASTLIHPNTGEQAINTRARQDIIDTVIGRGQHMSFRLDIFDLLPYTAYYFPLPGADGNPNAMLFIGVSREETLNSTATQFRNVILITILGLAVVSTIMYFLIRKTLQPLDTLAKNIKEVAKGNVNINIDREKITPDEIGMLTSDVYDLVDVIRAMVNDLTGAQNEYIMLGNIYYAIDNPIYQNSFKEAIGLVNQILSQTTENIVHMVNELGKIGDGDFSIKLRSENWPGDWAIVPQTVDNITANLKAVSNEIGGMIEAAAVKGNLDFKTDADKYNGDWQKIMIGLNDIAKAVDEPLKIIDIALKEMKMGNFDMYDIDAKLVANGLSANAEDFNGMLGDIMNSFNEALTDISSYINELETTLAKMSAGDLRSEIEREYVGSFDLIKRSVNNINNTLHKTMSKIFVASDQVLSGSKQISTSSADLASSAQEQASSIEELSTAISVINQQTKQNANNATEASNLSNKSAVNAQEGNEAMQQMLVAMSQIKESSNNISKIIKAIEGIAFQTNLLALNASVEAARAGEQGKGFSVVADEVRSLAARSQKSVTETTVLIEDSIERVESGSSIVESTSQSLDTIVKDAAEVLEVINSISIASKEQAEAIEQISEGLEQISKVTQHNSAISEETAAASQELSSQAEMLKQLVTYFKL